MASIQQVDPCKTVLSLVADQKCFSVYFFKKSDGRYCRKNKRVGEKRRF